MMQREGKSCNFFLLVEQLISLVNEIPVHTKRRGKRKNAAKDPADLDSGIFKIYFE